MLDSIGKLLLRLSIGGMILLHGVYKIVHGVDGVKHLLHIHHIPEILAYGVYVTEVIAPLFVIIGWRSRFWALWIVFDMVMAIFLTKQSAIYHLISNGAWGIETQALFLFGALSIACIGAGRYAISNY